MYNSDTREDFKESDKPVIILSWTRESNEQRQPRGLPKLRLPKDRNLEIFTAAGMGALCKLLTSPSTDVSCAPGNG